MDDRVCVLYLESNVFSFIWLKSIIMLSYSDLNLDLRSPLRIQPLYCIIGIQLVYIAFKHLV